MAKEVQLSHAELALGGLGVEVVPLQGTEHSLHMLRVLLRGLGVDEDVVKVTTTNLSRKGLSTWFMRVMNVLGALVSCTRNSK